MPKISQLVGRAAGIVAHSDYVFRCQARLCPGQQAILRDHTLPGAPPAAASLLSPSCCSNTKPVLCGAQERRQCFHTHELVLTENRSSRGCEAATVLSRGCGYSWEHQGRLAHTPADGRLSSRRRRRGCWAPMVGKQQGGE